MRTELRFVDSDKYKKILLSNNIDNEIKTLNDDELDCFIIFLKCYKDINISSQLIKDTLEICMKEKYERENKPISEADISLRKPIELSLDADGNILLYKRDNVDFETIYANSHQLLKIYEKTNNIEGMKYELCKQWMCKTLIDYKILYAKGLRKFLTDSKRKRAITLKSFIMNDMMKYLEIISKTEPNFNFQEYFNNTQFGIEIYKIDNRLIKASKLLLGV